MTRLFPVALLIPMLLLPTAASAQQDHTPRTSQHEARPPVKKVERPAAQSCAEFGAGFVRLEGSNTCVRVGGYLDVGTAAQGR